MKFKKMVQILKGFVFAAILSLVIFLVSSLLVDLIFGSNMKILTPILVIQIFF